MNLKGRVVENAPSLAYLGVLWEGGKLTAAGDFGQERGEIREILSSTPYSQQYY